MMKCSEERIRKNIEALAGFTRTPGKGCTRLSFTKEFRNAGDYIIEEMRSAGLLVREDAAGNIIGRYAGNSDGPVLLCGSHFDSVPHGGNFDGPAGIFTALEAVRVMKEHAVTPGIPIEVIAMPEEEGARFGSGLFGSRAICEGITPEELKQTLDTDGISQYEAMKEYGLNPDVIESAKRKNTEIAACLELHIEQGPVLEQQNKQIGIVDTIVGLQCFQITITGRADHAGTTPLSLRADALLAAAKAITAATRAAAALQDGTVVTFSGIRSGPAASNIVQSQVECMADCRSAEASSIEITMKAFQDSLKQSRQATAGNSGEPGLSWSIRKTLDAAPAAMNETLKLLLEYSAGQLGLSSIHLQSGAGHDAMNFAAVCPTAMIFVPSRGGRSHCPEEWTDYRRLADGADVLLQTLMKLSRRSQSYPRNPPQADCENHRHGREQ